MIKTNQNKKKKKIKNPKSTFLGTSMRTHTYMKYAYTYLHEVCVHMPHVCVFIHQACIRMKLSFKTTTKQQPNKN